MDVIIYIDLISVFLALMTFGFVYKLKPSFKKLIGPLLVVFYAVGVLVIVLFILEILGFAQTDQSPTTVGLHLLILTITLLTALSLDKLRSDQYKKAIENMKTLEKMKSEFLARTSHELKTPLTPLMMQLQMMHKGTFGKLNKKQTDSIVMIERNIRRLSELINDILFYSKSSAGRIKLDKNKCDLNSLVDEAVKTMQTKASKKRVSLSLEKADIPGVYCDSNRLSEVLVNLLDNSIKFVEKGGHVWVATKRDKNKVVVSVKDDGVGISKEDMGKLFVPFTQFSDVARRKQGGTGIGLSISKSLIMLHNGKIWAESEGKGKGSVFYFSLPLGNGK